MPIEFRNREFVFTGRLEYFTRKQAAALVKERGGSVAGSVTRSTRFLVVGEKPGGKLAKARSYRVSILFEIEFVAAITVTTPGFVARKTIIQAVIPETPIRQAEEIKGRRFKL